MAVSGLVRLLKALASGARVPDDIVLEAVGDAARVSAARGGKSALPPLSQLRQLAKNEGLDPAVASRARELLQAGTSSVSGATQRGMRSNAVRLPGGGISVSDEAADAARREGYLDDIDDILGGGDDSLADEVDDLLGLTPAGRAQVQTAPLDRRIRSRDGNRTISTLAAEPASEGRYGATTVGELTTLLPPGAGGRVRRERLLERVRPMTADTERIQRTRGRVVERTDLTPADISHASRGQAATRPSTLSIAAIQGPDGAPRYTFVTEGRDGMKIARVPVDPSTRRPLTLAEAEGGRSVSTETGIAEFDSLDEARQFMARAADDATRWRDQEAFARAEPRRPRPGSRTAWTETDEQFANQPQSVREEIRQVGGTRASRLTPLNAAEVRRSNMDVATERGEFVARDPRMGADLPDVALLARQTRLPEEEVRRRLAAAQAVPGMQFLPGDMSTGQQMLRIGAGAPGLRGIRGFEGEALPRAPRAPASTTTGRGGVVSMIPDDTTLLAERVRDDPRTAYFTQLMQAMRNPVPAPY